MGFVSSLIVMDVDGTLTEEISVWEYFHKKIGKWESEGKPNLKAYLSGEIDYTEFARLDTRAYQGLSRPVLCELALTIRRRRGVDRLLNRLKRRGSTLALISSGLNVLVDQFSPIDHAICNHLVFDENDICTGECIINVPIDGKKEAVQSLINRCDCSRENVIAMGDSQGDIPLMDAAGFSIAVASQDTLVQRVANAWIDGTDLMRAYTLIEDYLTGVDLQKPRHRR